MLKATITADLPSAQMENESGPLAWVKGLFGKRRDVSGQEELTVTAVQLLTGVAESFRAAGITNAISLLVDDAPVYLDTEDVPDDIEAMLAAAESSGVLDARFQAMELALTHSEQGLDVLVEVAIRNEVVLGAEEMEVSLAARPEELRVQAGESAGEYASRLRSRILSRARTDAYRRDLFALCERVAAAMRGALPDTTVTSAPAHFELVRPTREALGAFRHLVWGDAPAPVAYRPQPGSRSADTFARYYDDPYADFAQWVLIDAVINHGALRARSTKILWDDGKLGFRGDQADRYDIHRAGIAGIDFDEYGALDVDSRLPS